MDLKPAKEILALMGRYLDENEIGETPIGHLEDCLTINLWHDLDCDLVGLLHTEPIKALLLLRALRTAQVTMNNAISLLNVLYDTIQNAETDLALAISDVEDQP